MSDKKPSIQVLPTEKYFSLVRQMLSDSGQAYVRVTGISMQPLLRHLRDGVVIVPPEKIRTGDIVLFDRLNGRYALHRVIRKKKDGFTMVGDNQWFAEENLPYGQIVGVVTCIDRGGRRIDCTNLFLKIYSGTVTFFALPRIYIRNTLVRIAKALRPSRNEQKKGGSE